MFKKIIAMAATAAMVATTMMSITSGAESIKGDINYDGYIDSVDASMVLAEYANTSVGKSGTLTETQKYLADTNRDGEITPEDASKIMSVYAYNSTHEDAYPVTEVVFCAYGQPYGKEEFFGEFNSYEDALAEMKKRDAEGDYGKLSIIMISVTEGSTNNPLIGKPIELQMDYCYLTQR